MANIKYADTSIPLIAPTDDDQVMFKTGAGGDGRAPLVQPKGYIDGLKLEYISPTQVRVTSGAAYVPGPKRIAELAAPVTLSPSLAVSTWYHVYLTVAGGVVSAEASTTAPAAPYTGTARAKTGDTSRRYIGSFKTMPSSAVIARFMQTGNYIGYTDNINQAPFFVLIAGTATTRTTVSFAGVVPETSTMVNCSTQNNAGQSFVLGTSDLATLNATSHQAIVPAGALGLLPSTFQLSAARSIDYLFTSAPSGAGYLAASGYWYER